MKSNKKILLECEDLCIGYGGKAVAENLNFMVETGDYLCVLGQNGSGKSTLIKTLLGLEKPISGTIEGILKPRQIGFLPQSTDSKKDFPATVKETLKGCVKTGQYLLMNFALSLKINTAARILLR